MLSLELAFKAGIALPFPVLRLAPLYHLNTENTTAVSYYTNQSRNENNILLSQKLYKIKDEKPLESWSDQGQT